jgi:hypothetical protein
LQIWALRRRMALTMSDKYSIFDYMKKKLFAFLMDFVFTFL